MPSIVVDFEVFKEVTARRAHEGVSENDVLREALGLPASGQKPASAQQAEGKFWTSEGVRFPVGTRLRHRFRGSGRIVEAEMTEHGVRLNGRTFSGLSPAAAESAGHQSNGWQFWEVQQEDGTWKKADSLRHS